MNAEVSMENKDKQVLLRVKDLVKHFPVKLGAFGESAAVVHPQEQIRKVIEIVQAVPMDEIFESTADADAYLDALQRRILDGEEEP